MKSHRLPALLFSLLAACVVPADDTALSVDEPIGQSKQMLCNEPDPIFADPITRTEHPESIQVAVSFGTGQFGTATATLPGDGSGQPAEGRFPLVVILHGNGFGFDDYSALQEHLAKNGFVTVSPSWDSDTLNLATVKDPLLDFLLDVHLTWQHKGSLDGRVAFVGHSRGGEVAARFAPDVANLWPLDALVLMAPAPNDELRDVFVGYHSAELLVLFGADDDDTAANGSQKAAWPAGAHKNGFYYHDLYGPLSNEHTSLCNMPTYEKAMVYMKDLSHAAWQSDPSELPIFNTPCTGGQLGRCEDMTKGFVSAFLHWQMNDEDQYVPLFQGKARPASLDPVFEYQSQFSGRWRAVVDSFTKPGLASNDAGGSVTINNVIAAEDSAPVLLASSTHASGALSVSWPQCNDATCTTPFVEFSIPATAAARDASAATYFSIRAGTLDANNVPDFHVQLISGDDVASPLVPISTYGGVAEKYPTELMIGTSRYAMSSTLIPMCAFEDVDLSDVERVRVVFDAPGHDTGIVMIDNLEFLHEGGNCP